MPRRDKETSDLLAVLDTGPPSEVADALNRLAGRLTTLTRSQRELLSAAARIGIGSADPAVRGQAMFALAELGEDPNLLEKGLDDSDWFVRLAAVNGLARAQPPIRLGALDRLRDDPEPLVSNAVLAIFDEHDEAGMPMSPKSPLEPKSPRTGWMKWRPWLWQEVSWDEWRTRELAMLREDLFRRDPWNNLIALMVVFAIAIAALSLIANATLGEAVVLGIAAAIGFAPLTWVRGWKWQHRQALLPNRFDLLELLLVGGWMLLVMLILFSVERVMGWW